MKDKDINSLDPYKLDMSIKIQIWNRHFWSRGYFVDIVRCNKKQVTEYIRNQLAEDQIADPIRLKEYIDLFTGSKA